MARQQSTTSRRSSQRRDASRIRSSQSESPGSKAAEMGPLPKLTIKLRFNLKDPEEKTDPFPTTLNDERGQVDANIFHWVSRQLKVTEMIATGRVISDRNICINEDST